EGLHPPGIFNSNEKRILPSAAIRKRIHFGDWPVYCRFRSHCPDSRQFARTMSMSSLAYAQKPSQGRLPEKGKKRAAIPLGDDKQAATERSPPPLAGVSAIACFTFRSVARA